MHVCVFNNNSTLNKTVVQAAAAEEKLRQIQDCNKQAVKENCRWAVVGTTVCQMQSAQSFYTAAACENP